MTTRPARSTSSTTGRKASSVMIPATHSSKSYKLSQRNSVDSRKVAKLRSSSCGITSTSMPCSGSGLHSVSEAQDREIPSRRQSRHREKRSLHSQQSEDTKLYDESYTAGSALYCGNKQTVEQIMAGIGAWVDRL